MVGDSLGYRDHAEMACGVLGYGSCGVVGVVINMLLFATMGVSMCIGVAAIAATLQECDSYFNEKPSWDRIGSYRIPYIMMISIGLCLVPVIGIMYALAMWAVYFSGERFE